MFMLIIAIALGIAIAANVAYSPLPQIEATVTQGRIAALAVAHLTYHQALTRYATANPAATGTVDEVTLGLPPWLVNPGFTHDISAAGIARSWLDPNQPAFMEARWIAAEMASRQVGAVAVGIVQADGVSYLSPSAGRVVDAASVANIPPGSIAVFTKVR